jgi:hypothetical protein
VAEYDKVIPPGGSGKIITNVRTENFGGSISKPVTITSDSTENRQVTILCKTYVKNIFEVRPTGRLSKNIKFHENYKDQVTIRQMDGKPFAIDNVENTSDLFKTEVVPPAEPGGVYVLKIRTSSPPPIGRITNRSKVHTNNPRKPVIDIFEHVTVEGPVATNPYVLQFFKGEAGDTTAVSVYPTDKNRRIRIKKITAPDGIKAEITQKTDGKNYVVQATLTRAMGYTSGLKLSIETDQRDQPVVELPILIVSHAKPIEPSRTGSSDSAPGK